MNKLTFITLCGLLALSASVVAGTNEDSPVCNSVGELMHGDQQKCKKGDVIMVNPMVAALLCDMNLPTIPGEKIVVCHYLGKKRPVRNPKK